MDFRPYLRGSAGAVPRCTPPRRPDPRGRHARTDPSPPPADRAPVAPSDREWLLRPGAQFAERREKRLVFRTDRRFQPLAEPLREGRAAAARRDRDGEIPPPDHRGDQESARLRRVRHVHQAARVSHLVRHAPVDLGVVRGREHEEGIREVPGPHGSAREADRAAAARSAIFRVAAGLTTVTSAPQSSSSATFRSATRPPPTTRQRRPARSTIIG